MKNKKSGKLVGCFVWLLIATFLLCLNYVITGTFLYKCIIHSITGYDCPACGLQRMVLALLTGNFIEAFWYNPYLILISPYVGALLCVQYVGGTVAVKLKKILYHPATIAVFAILMVAWVVSRNMPFWKEFVEIQITSM